MGSSSLFILWWKRHTRIFLMFDIIGFYESKNSKIEGFSDITAIVKVAFFNGSDETISVTDIIGTLKYNKERYKALVASDIKGLNEVFSVCPTNLDKVIPFSILPHETVKKQLMIEFPTVILDAIYRIPTMKFVGFLDGKIPLYYHNEKQFKENWNASSPTMLLTVHVNAKKRI